MNNTQQESVAMAEQSGLISLAKHAILEKKPTMGSPTSVGDKYLAFLPGDDSVPSRMKATVIEVDGVRYQIYSQ